MDEGNNSIGAHPEPPVSEREIERSLAGAAMSPPVIDPSATVSSLARIEAGVHIGQHAHVREGARLGTGTRVGIGAYIDHDVSIGCWVQIHNYALVYYDTVVEDGAMLGPACCLASERAPRAITRQGQPQRRDERTAGRVHVGRGATVGAGAIILPDVTVGPWAMVGAGAVVTRNVPAYGLVVGVPARLVGYVCACGARLRETLDLADLICPACRRAAPAREEPAGPA